MARTAEFSRKTKMAAWERADGRCEHEDIYRSQHSSRRLFIRERCNKKLSTGDIFYDHRIPEAISHDNSLANCQVLCRAHHDEKTATADVPTIAKVKRIQAKHVGASKPSSRGFAQSRYRKLMDGRVVDRETGELIRRPQ